MGLFAMKNQQKDSQRNRFLVTPKDELEAEKSGGGARNGWPWYSYMIVSVQSGVPGEMSSWRLREDQEGFAEERIEIRGR